MRGGKTWDKEKRQANTIMRKATFEEFRGSPKNSCSLRGYCSASRRRDSYLLECGEDMVVKEKKLNLYTNNASS